MAASKAVENEDRPTVIQIKGEEASTLQCALVDKETFPTTNIIQDSVRVLHLCIFHTSHQVFLLTWLETVDDINLAYLSAFSGV